MKGISAIIDKMENLNYSASGLRATFPKCFTAAEAKRYARRPEAIANRADANRMGNGPEASGDGWRWKGRGLVQITGTGKHAKYGIENTPEKALDPAISLTILFDRLSSGKFTGKKLSDYFNGTTTDWVGARKIINYHG